MASATPAPAPPRDQPYVAVEFDLLDDSGHPVTILLCNRGTVTRYGTAQYYPRLTGLPIMLGATLTVTQYGQPVRAAANGGSIQFLIDASIWIWTAYHWIGRPFRAYEGSAPNLLVPQVDVDADMALVYVGRIAGLTHDTITATVQTTDAGFDIDNPLVTDFYDDTFPIGLQGRPKPYLWGIAYSTAPQIENETTQTYRFSARPLLPGEVRAVFEVRVGGVPWDQVGGNPGPGQWTPNLADGTFQLGSPPAGEDVRCDAQQGIYTIGGLITAIVTQAGGLVDTAALAQLDAATNGAQASYATTTTPVNRLSAIDDFTNSGGCWWGFNAVGAATGGIIDVPAAAVSYALNEVQLDSVNLNTIQPLAWRIRTGSARNWQPETSFDTAVLQTDVARWSAPGIVYEPHYENANALALEIRAVDVPLLAGTSPLASDAQTELLRLISAWGGNRSVYDLNVWMRPDDILLYDNVEVDYIMVTGNFRITSAIRAIGGGPATLQVWGILGPVPPAPAPLPLPPPYIGPGPITPTSPTPPAGSGSTTPVPAAISFLPSASIALSSTSLAGLLVASVAVTMSDGSAFAGTLTITTITGPAAATGPVALPTPGYYPNLADNLTNLNAQYVALPAALQAEYNSVVGGDPTDFNNTTGLQNKVNLVSLLTAYAGLAPLLQAQYDSTLAGNNGAFYNNTPGGVVNKLSLIQSYFVPPGGPAIYAPNFAATLLNINAQYTALPAVYQAEYDSVVGGDPTDFNNTTGLQNKAYLVALLTSYSRLSLGLQTLYDYTIGVNTAAYNNTPGGVVNKLSLIQSFYTSPPWAAQNGNFLTIQGSALDLLRNLAAANDDGISTFTIVAAQNGASVSGILAVSVS